MQLTQVLNAPNKVHIKRESVLQLNRLVRVLGSAAQNRLSVNLLALTATTPSEEKPRAVTGREPPPRTHVISDDVFG